MSRAMALILAAVLAGADGAAAARSGKTEAVTYQIDLAHTGSVSFAKFSTPLKLKWNVDLGGQVSYPLIAGGKVFVTAYAGNESTRLVALDLKTGAILWQSPIGGAPNYWSGSAYDSGTVFVVDFEGGLQAFNAKTGRIKWGNQLFGQYQFTSPPLATGGRLFVTGYGSNATLYAVDEKNGATLWTDDESGGGYGPPALGDGELYATYECDVYAMDPASGAVHWTYNYGCEGGGGKTPVYVSHMLYARNQVNPNTIFDAEDGAPLGTFAAGPAPAFFTDASGTLMEAVLSGTGGTLSVLDPATGKVAWSSIGDKYLTSAPIVINGKVIIGTGFGKLCIFDGATGHLDWATNVGSAILAPNEYSAASALTGLGAAADTLIVPATNTVLAYSTK